MHGVDRAGGVVPRSVCSETPSQASASVQKVSKWTNTDYFGHNPTSLSRQMWLKFDKDGAVLAQICTILHG